MSPLTTWYRDALAEVRANAAALVPFLRQGLSKLREKATPTAAAQVLPEQDVRAKREIMKEWRLVARRTFIPVILFSVFINLLMLTVIALSFIGVLSLLDIMRRHVLSGLATRFETVLGGALLASIITTA